MSKAILAGAVVALAILSPLPEATTQTYYCLADSCPTEAALATFHWHLTHSP